MDKVKILILPLIFLAFSSAFAQGTAKEAVDKGVEYARQGNLDAAISEFNKALALDSGYTRAYYDRALTYHGKGDYAKAVSDYTKAVTLDPNLARAYNNRAITYCYQKEYAKAWEDVHKAEALGYKIDPLFLGKLKKTSGREK